MRSAPALGEGPWDREVVEGQYRFLDPQPISAAGDDESIEDEEER